MSTLADQMKVVGLIVVLWFIYLNREYGSNYKVCDPDFCVSDTLMGIMLVPIGHMTPIFGFVWSPRTLKWLLRKQFGFPICIQRLLRDGECLEDSEHLDGDLDLQLVLLAILGAEERQEACKPRKSA